MSCIIRVGGTDLDVDALLQSIDLAPDRVWHKGEIRGPKGKGQRHSGATFMASPADLNEFDQQVKDATEYLEQHSTAIKSIVAFPGVEWAVIDFGIEIREGFVAYNDFLPARFIKAAGITGINVELSHYPSSEEEEES